MAYRRARVIANEPPSREFKKLIRKLVPEEICLRLRYRRGSTSVDQLSHKHTHARARAFVRFVLRQKLSTNYVYRENTESTFFIISPLNCAGKYTRENNRINFEYLLSVNKRFIDHGGNFTTTIFSGYRSGHVLQASRELNFTSRTRYRTIISFNKLLRNR